MSSSNLSYHQTIVLFKTVSVSYLALSRVCIPVATDTSSTPRNTTGRNMCLFTYANIETGLALVIIFGIIFIVKKYQTLKKNKVSINYNSILCIP
jgi:hypothetical protein